MAELGVVAPSPRNGDDPFRRNGNTLNLRVIDFWRWSTSNLLSNATRGVLAEFIVGSALGCLESVRNQWNSYDLRTSTGITVEVKSSAYVQTWHQKAYSRITFSIRASRYWDANTGSWAGDVKRLAWGYFFALLAHRPPTR